MLHSGDSQRIRVTLLVLALVGWVTSSAPGILASRMAASGKSSRVAERVENGSLKKPPGGGGDVGDATRLSVSEAYGKLPMTFEPNRGQASHSVEFIARGPGYGLLLTRESALLALRTTEEPHGEAKAKRVRTIGIRLSFAGGRPVELAPEEELSGKANYLIGRSPESWVVDVPTFRRVSYRGIYPGIDLVYYGNGKQLEYDLILSPESKPGDIRLRFEGVRRKRVDSNGDLLLDVGGHQIRHQKPVAYQNLNGTRRTVLCRYIVRGRFVSFELGAYDRTKPLVIDPVLGFSTFLGGTSTDVARAIAVDGSGSAFVAGRTFSFNFPIVIGSYDTTYANSNDVFVTKLNPAGSGLVYSTYLGGNSEDSAFGLAIDTSGNAHLTGSTSSTDFPTTPGAYRTSLQGGSFPGDAFATKLNSAGSNLVYSTYLGGSSSDQGNAIALDLSGNAYVTGYTNSSNFPTTMGAFQTTFGGSGCCTIGDAFVTKLNGTGTGLDYSTFLGAMNSEVGTSIAVDGSGNATVTGSTNSASFPTSMGAYQTTYGGGSTFAVEEFFGDCFVTRLNSTGTGLIYSTFLGSSGDEGGLGVDVDSSGNAYVAGPTNSAGLPATQGVVRAANGGMLKTTNGGTSWAPRNNGITNTNIASITIDPADLQVVYVGTLGGGIFKTTNGGGTWSAMNNGLTELNIRATDVDPANASTVYLGTSGRGVFRSTDGGANWAGINTGLSNGSVNDLLVNPTLPQTIYAATEGGVFKTTDGGANWMLASTGLGFGSWRTLAIDPAFPSTLYVGGFGVFKTTNGGASWAATSLRGISINSLALDGAATYAGTDNAIFKSMDRGTTWDAVDSGLTNRDGKTLATVPGGGVYVGTRDGTFMSTDGGASWSAVNTGLSGAVVNAIAVHPAAASTLYAGTAPGGTDGFVAKLNLSGSGLDFLTYLGGDGQDQPFAVVTDSSANVYVAGFTSSSNFPFTLGAFGPASFFGDRSGFVTKLNSTATGFVYSTHLGGNSSDQVYALAMDLSGSAYVAGYTNSSDFPVTPGAYQGSLAGFSTDAFVAKLEPAPSLSADLQITKTANFSTATPGGGTSYTITLTNNGPDAAQAISLTDNLDPATSFNFCSSSFLQCSGFGSGVRLTLRSLAPGEPVTATIFANVKCWAANGTLLTNIIRVESATPDPDQANNTATATVTVSTSNPFPILPVRVSFGPEGGTGLVSVRLPVGCDWTATSNTSWLTISSGSSGSGAGAVNYSVGANPSATTSRVGTMTIAGQTFTVFQITPGADTDSDGIPDSVEVAEGRNLLVKDNDIFTNARLFVMQQYRDFLGREGDSNGIAFWVNQIAIGAQTRAQVVSSFFNSAEFQNTTAPVTRLYFAYFLRIPDYGGLTFWVNQFKGGVPLNSISNAFAQSTEFQNRYGSLNNSQFVTLVYNNVLGRAPDPGGLAFWTGQLDSGAMTRGQVMLGFSESPEYRSNIFNEVFVVQIYIGMLRRSPDQGGFDFWVGLLDGGGSGLGLIQGFLSSTEYRNRFLPPA